MYKKKAIYPILLGLLLGFAKPHQATNGKGYIEPSKEDQIMNFEVLIKKGKRERINFTIEVNNETTVSKLKESIFDFSGLELEEQNPLVIHTGKSGLEEINDDDLIFKENRQISQVPRKFPYFENFKLDKLQVELFFHLTDIKQEKETLLEENKKLQQENWWLVQQAKEIEFNTSDQGLYIQYIEKNNEFLKREVETQKAILKECIRALAPKKNELKDAKQKITELEKEKKLQATKDKPIKLEKDLKNSQEPGISTLR